MHYHEQLGSSNDEGRRVAELGAEQGTVVLAEQQSAGRGRRGAVWASDSGDGLLFSLVLRPEYSRAYWSRLALASGLGIVYALRKEWGVEAQIKWPNDVYIDGKKCAGILVESQDGFAVVGVGLNVQGAPEGDDSTSLAEQLGESVCREEVLAAVLDGLFEESKHCADRFSWQLERMRPLCWLTGKQVSFQSNQVTCRGLVRGIGGGGDLLVEIDGEIQPFQQAELIRVVS